MLGDLLIDSNLLLPSMGPFRILRLCACGIEGKLAERQALHLRQHVTTFQSFLVTPLATSLSLRVSVSQIWIVGLRGKEAITKVELVC
jgi:hypothetical protein